jgi:hypothetical protein
MYRGSADLLQKSARALVPVIEFIAHSEAMKIEDGTTPWDVDLHCYTKLNITLLLQTAEKLRAVLPPGASDILVTKTMLGVFGNVPAFDDNFKHGCKVARICATFGKWSLNEIGRLYEANVAVIDRYRVPALDFRTGQQTERLYTRAKVMDMAFFMEGMKREKVAKALGQAASQG